MAIFTRPVGRATRGQLLACLAVGAVAFPALDLATIGGFDPVLRIGPRFDGFSGEPGYAWWRTALVVAFDLALAFVTIARLHDFGKSGWLAALPFVPLLTAMTVPALALPLFLVAIAMLAVLLFWPGDIGPNSFGTDPRGWLSREKYEEQMRDPARNARLKTTTAPSPETESTRQP